MYIYIIYKYIHSYTDPIFFLHFLSISLSYKNISFSTYYIAPD